MEGIAGFRLRTPEERRPRTGSGEKLVADLEHAHQIGNLLCEFHRGGKRIEIQCDNQAAAGMGIEGR